MDISDPSDHGHPATVRVCGYVDRCFDDVTRDLDGRAGCDTFARAFKEVTGTAVELTSTKEQQVSRDVAHYRVGWHVEDRVGSATVSAMAVQRGRDPVTEVLVHVELTDSEEGTDPEVVAGTMRQFIDALSFDLATQS